MPPAKKKSPAKKAPTKKAAPAKKTIAKKSPAKKAPAKKSAAKKSAGKKEEKVKRAPSAYNLFMKSELAKVKKVRETRRVARATLLCRASLHSRSTRMRVLLALPKSRDVLHRADAHRVPFPPASSRCPWLPWEPSPARMHTRDAVSEARARCRHSSRVRLEVISPASRAFVTPNGRDEAGPALFPDRCMPPFPRRPPSSAGQPEARPQGRLHHRRAELVEAEEVDTLRIPAVTVSTRLASCDSCVSLLSVRPF